MKIIYQVNYDHHNSGTLSLVVSGKILYECFLISKYQAEKVAKHFCGIESCDCPEGQVEILGLDRGHKPTAWGLSVDFCQE